MIHHQMDRRQEVVRVTFPYLQAENSLALGLLRRSASRTRDVFLIYEEREEPSIDESVEKAAQR